MRSSDPSAERTPPFDNDEVMAKNPAQLGQYRSGKEAVFGFFVGQVMKASGGMANPTKVNELLKRKLRA